MDIERIVGKAVTLGASEAEVYFIRSSETILELSKVVEASKSVTLSSLGIRVVVGKSIATVGTQNLSDEGVEKALESALSIARVTPPDPKWVSVNRKVSLSHVSGLFDRDTAEATSEDLSPVATDLLGSVKEGCKDAEPVRGAVATRSVEITYMNTYGGPITRSETLSNLYVYAKVSEGGRTGTYNEYDVRRSLRELKAREVGIEAGVKAREFVNAGRLPNGDYELILLNRVTASILFTMLAPSISALNVQQGRSPLAGRLGEALMSEDLTVVDLGASDNVLGSKQFDDEGHPTSNLAIVEKGVLKTYLYDTYTALREGRESTGNAARTYTSGPLPQPHHLHLKPGKVPLDDIIHETKNGVLVMITIGEWLSNSVSGHLNATITHAYTIRDGELFKPVKDAVISSNIYELLKSKLEVVGNDIRYNYGVSTPSLKFSNVRVAGK